MRILVTGANLDRIGFALRCGVLEPVLTCEEMLACPGGGREELYAFISVLGRGHPSARSLSLLAQLAR